MIQIPTTVPADGRPSGLRDGRSLVSAAGRVGWRGDAPRGDRGVAATDERRARGALREHRDDPQRHLLRPGGRSRSARRLDRPPRSRRSRCGSPTASGGPAAPGEPGEIQVRHPGVFAGYFQRPHATARRSRATASCGPVIWPSSATTERCASSGGAVTCTSPGAPTSTRARSSCAWNATPRRDRRRRVGARPALQRGRPCVHRRAPRRGRDRRAELAAWCAARLANYKRPKRIVVADELPMLPNAKIDRRALAAHARGEVAMCADGTHPWDVAASSARFPMLRPASPRRVRVHQPPPSAGAHL